MGNSPKLSCPTNPSQSTTKRTAFGTRGCSVYGYPSTGGILIKEAAFLDMLFLSLSRSHISYRSSTAEEEDRFCNLLRQTGATLWPSMADWVDTQLGERDFTKEEAKVLVFGWPADRVGVWVLRFASVNEIPRDFGKLSLAINMDNISSGYKVPTRRKPQGQIRFQMRHELQIVYNHDILEGDMAIERYKMTRSRG